MALSGGLVLPNERDWGEVSPQQLPETPPQTGTSLPFIWPPPQHLETPPPFEEPVLSFPPAESLLERETELDARRCEEPGKHEGKQVYDSLSPPPDDDNFARVRGATPAEDMPRWYVPVGPEDDTILFESRFESGNLRSAERIGESEYNLHLAFDINTDRHTQWFYFRMSNLRKGRPYKLNMQNLMKTEAVYNLGMQPLAYSEARANGEHVGWYRTGWDACYFKNQLTRAGSKPFWTLTFTVDTKYDRDTVYLAHCFPYRYTDLQRYLSRMEASPLGRSSTFRRRTLCQTLAGNDCDMVTITSPQGDSGNKKGIVISARVHPGETNASWMMKGVLDYITSDSLQAVALREKFVFKIVPMLNPDGVIVGNYRCSLAGGDLNRQYEDPKRELFPEVLNLKQMVANFGLGKEVLLFVDLHGHSKKSNIFMYGVENPSDVALYMRERVIPTLLDRASPLFNLKDCSFDVGKGKEGCGRVVVRKQLGIVNAFTMEASFMGADQGKFEGIHFNQGHLESMGHSLCEVLLELVDPDQSKVEQIVRDLTDKCPIDQSRVVHPRDEDVGGDSASDDSDSDSPARLSAKPSKRIARDTGTPRQASRAKGPGKKCSPRERDKGRRGSSDSETDDARNDKQRGSREAKSAGTDKAPTKAVPAKGTPRTSSSPCSSTAIQKQPQARPATPKAAKPGSGTPRSSTPKSSTPKSSTPKSSTPKSSTPKSSTPKSGTAKKAPTVGISSGSLVGAAVGSPKASSPARATSAKRSSSGANNVSCASNGSSAKVGGAGARPVSGKGLGSSTTRRPKVSPTSAAGVAGGGPTKKADKKSTSASGPGSGASSGSKGVARGVPPLAPSPAGPARRPASSPASRSVSSPRRQQATREAERSPSAPPKSMVSSSRGEAGNAGSSKAGGKAKGGGGGSSGSASSSTANGKARGKKGRNKDELPLPPLRSKSTSTRKSAK